MDIGMTFIYGITIFIDLLRILVIFDVVLSWLMLMGVKWRPKFLSEIIDPVYAWVKSIIPTNFGPFDFTPIIIIFTLMFINYLIIGLFPDVLLLMKVN